MKKTLALSGMLIMGALGMACEPAANVNTNANRMNSNMMNSNMMNSNMGHEFKYGFGNNEFKYEFKFDEFKYEFRFDEFEYEFGFDEFKYEFRFDEFKYVNEKRQLDDEKRQLDDEPQHQQTVISFLILDKRAHQLHFNDAALFHLRLMSSLYRR